MPARIAAAKASPKVRAFYEQLPLLFATSKPAWEKAYNELIYRIERPLTRANVAEVVAWADGGKLKGLDSATVATINEALLPIRWPDVRRLGRLRTVEGMTLPRAAALLHFHSPSFPPFTEESVRGLALIGKRGRRPAKLALEDIKAYRGHMDRIAALKEGVPFRFVPESHYFHSWVLECALGELARRGNGHRGR